MSKPSDNPLSALPKRERDRIAKRVDALMSKGSRLHARGKVAESIAAYREAIKLVPWYSGAHYDLGLVYKYSRRWRPCLAANLRALELAPDDEAARWNAGIAATALGDWKTAREMWKRQGITLPEGSGDPASHMGPVVVRLNPWGEGETVWAARICPARAVIANVPLPDSGYRCGDVVLHDGAPQGTRTVDGEEVPVFNVLQRLVRSNRPTFSAELCAASPGDIEQLEEAAAERRIRVEDWTQSVQGICLRCSYGIPHRHRKRRPAAEWQSDRSVGVAATSKADAEALLAEWQRSAPGRSVTAIHAKHPRIVAARPRYAWWSHEDFSKRNG